MLRRFSGTLFRQQNQIKQILIKTCSSHARAQALNSEIEETPKRLVPQNLLQELFSPIQNKMFRQPSSVSAENIQVIHDLIQQAEDFNFLISSLSKNQRDMVIDAFSRDLSSLQKLLAPLTGNNQRQVMDFIGLDRLRVLRKKASILLNQSTELEFFLTSESLNFVLKRENHNYLYEMREREETMIAARPTSIKHSMQCP